MNKLLYGYILLLIIIYSECSKCTDFKLPETKENASSSSSGSPASSSNGPASSSNGSPASSSNGNPASSSSGSSSSSSNGSPASSSNESPASSNSEQLRRRLANEVTEKDCKDLETSNNEKYKCVLKSDHKGCEEISKEWANKLRISLSILIFLFII